MLVLGSIFLGAAGALALWGAYRALELNWPEQYLSLNDTFALRLTETWWRLLLYRFLPVFVLGVAIGATASRLGADAMVALVVMAVIHAGQTNVRAIFESFGWVKSPRGVVVNYAPYHAWVVVVILLATAGAILFGPTLSFLVPAPGVLLENVWIAIFVAIAGGIALGVIGHRPHGSHEFDAAYFVWRAKKDVGLDLVDWAFETAVEHRSDPILIRSIMFAEALQRPSWVRRLERVKGKVLKRGTYGVTQEAASKPISDREAITRTARKLHGAWAIEPENGPWGWSDPRIWKYAALHNENVTFIQGVQSIYREVLSDRATVPMFRPPDELHIIEIRRYPNEFGLRGVTVAKSLEFYVATDSKPHHTVSHSRPNDIATGAPWAFEARFPIDTEVIRGGIQMPKKQRKFELDVGYLATLRLDEWARAAS